MGAGVLALGAEDGGEGEGGSKLVQTALTDGVTTGEAKGLGHEALAAAAVEQTVPSQMCWRQGGLQLPANGRQERLRLLATRGHVTE